MADNEDRSFDPARDPSHGKDTPAYKADPGQSVLGDGTEEQALSSESDEDARITQEDVEAAFNDRSGAAEDGAEPGAR